MGIGFSFKTEACEKKNVVEILNKLVNEFELSFFHEHENTFRVQFCRAGDLFISHDPKTRELSGECRTNVAGPGFHAAAIRFLDDFFHESRLSFELEDETNFHAKRDFIAMRKEHFHGWLEGLLHMAAERAVENGTENLCISWPMGQYVPENIPGTLVTSMGRFSVKNLINRVAEEGVQSFADDFFIWNEEKKDGRFYRNTALAMLWEDCFFMPSSRSERDRAINGEILHLLEKAHGLDPDLPFPREAYSLLCSLHHHKGIPTSSLPELKTDFPIGYRRGKVMDRLGNLSFSFPGHFLYESQNNNQDHVFWDGLEKDWQSFRISAFGLKKAQADFDGELFENMEEKPETFSIGNGRCRATFAGRVTEGDANYYQIVAEILSGKQLTLVTASFEKKTKKNEVMTFLKNIKTQMQNRA